MFWFIVRTQQHHCQEVVKLCQLEEKMSWLLYSMLPLSYMSRLLLFTSQFVKMIQGFSNFTEMKPKVSIQCAWKKWIFWRDLKIRSLFGEFCSPLRPYTCVRFSKKLLHFSHPQADRVNRFVISPLVKKVIFRFFFGGKMHDHAITITQAFCTKMRQI